MAYSTAPKVRRDGKITLKDGTSTPVTLEVAYEKVISLSIKPSQTVP